MNRYLAARLAPFGIDQMNELSAAARELMLAGWHGFCGGPDNCDRDYAERQTRFYLEHGRAR